MFIQSDRRDDLDKLANKLTRATRASAVLFGEVFAASPRLMTLRTIGKTGRLDRLVACEAWTEAVMELIALEAPAWTVRRLCRDDRDWLCTLTRFLDVPDWLDESVEGRHPVLALAALGAVLDLRARTAVTSRGVAHELAGVTADCADYR